MDPKPPVIPEPAKRARITAPGVELINPQSEALKRDGVTSRRQFVEGEVKTEKLYYGGERTFLRVEAMGYCYDGTDHVDFRWKQDKSEGHATDIPLKLEGNKWVLDEADADAINLKAALRVMKRLDDEGKPTPPAEIDAIPSGGFGFDLQAKKPTVMDWRGPYTQQQAALQREYEDYRNYPFPSVHLATWGARYYFDEMQNGCSQFPKDCGNKQVIAIHLSNGPRSAEPVQRDNPQNYFLVGTAQNDLAGNPVFRVESLLARVHSPRKGLWETPLPLQQPLVIPLKDGAPLLEEGEWRQLGNTIEHARLNQLFVLTDASRDIGRELLGAIMPVTPLMQNKRAKVNQP